MLMSSKVGHQRHFSAYLILTSLFLGHQNHFLSVLNKNSLTSAFSAIIFVCVLIDMCCYEKDL